MESNARHLTGLKTTVVVIGISVFFSRGSFFLSGKVAGMKREPIGAGLSMGVAEYKFREAPKKPRGFELSGSTAQPLSATPTSGGPFS